MVHNATTRTLGVHRATTEDSGCQEDMMLSSHSLSSHGLSIPKLSEIIGEEGQVHVAQCRDVTECHSDVINNNYEDQYKGK